MENIKKAIKHFECVKSDAVAVLDSGFGIKPNESNTIYKNRKLYAELAISALDKQIPKKVELEGDGYDENGNLIYDTGYCPNCRHIFEVDYDATEHCPECGQALDWSDSE